MPISSEIKINIGIMREGKFQEIKEIPTLGDLNIEEPDELTRNSLEIIKNGAGNSIEALRQLGIVFTNFVEAMGSYIGKPSNNNWCKMHHVPMRRKTLSERR